MSGYKDKVTPGPVTAMPADPTYHDVVRVFADGAERGAQAIAAFPQSRSAAAELLDGRTNETTEAASNASLFVDAKNVLHETDYTPRELAEQRAELLAAAKFVLSALMADMQITARSRLRAAIDKCEADQ